MPDTTLNRLLNLKVAKDRKGMAPNKPTFALSVLFVEQRASMR